MPTELELDLTKKAAPHVRGEELQENRKHAEIAIPATTDNTTAEDYKIFNPYALGVPGAVFITSSKRGAEAIMAVGGQAAALGGPANYKEFMEAVNEHKRDRPLLLALDNDVSGSRTTSDLIGLFYEDQIPYMTHDPYGGYANAVEALDADRAAFEAAIREGEAIIERAEQAKREAELKQYQTGTAGAHLDKFIKYIESMAPVIPTGFSQLDEAIGGGLRADLYVVGASPGAGKTTFLVQIADHLAREGQDVLFFSLEMSRYELMAKSISRYTYAHAERPALRKTAVNVLDYARLMEKYNPHKDRIRETEELLAAAYEDYRRWGGRLWIVQGNGDIATDSRPADPANDQKAHRGIRDIIEEHIQITGNIPVVILDYLQIIQSHNRYWTAKENMDYISSELKRITRDCKAPIIAITSYNRGGYETGGMAAVKESGGVEYAVSVLLGLNHLERKLEPWYDEKKKKVHYQGTKKDGDPHTDPRKIELEIYKNRHGKIGNSIKYKYYAAFNYFEELKPGEDYPDERAIQDLISDHERSYV